MALHILWQSQETIVLFVCIRTTSPGFHSRRFGQFNVMTLVHCLLFSPSTTSLTTCGRRRANVGSGVIVRLVIRRWNRLPFTPFVSVFLHSKIVTNGSDPHLLTVSSLIAIIPSLSSEPSRTTSYFRTSVTL